MIFQLKAVEKHYQNRVVLNVDALDIHSGEILAIVGPSGAGKSTLLRLLALLEAPTHGQVAFISDGHPYTYANLPLAVRRQLVMVFQRPSLLTRSVRSNLAYGLQIRGRRNQQERVDSMLDKIAMRSLEHARPHTLSGGELQRVALARALILEPQVLILDEPTVNLDPQNVQLIESILLEQQRQSQMTMIVVTHNLFQAKRIADRIALIYEGNLIEVTDTHTFFENPGDERTAAFTGGHLVY